MQVSLVTSDGRAEDDITDNDLADSAAAWGEPAIVARCGLAPPAPTADLCIHVDGVDWISHRLSDGYAFTTYGRTPALEVLVPDRYAPGPLLLPAFDGAAAALPGTGHTCS